MSADNHSSTRTSKPQRSTSAGQPAQNVFYRLWRGAGPPIRLRSILAVLVTFPLAILAWGFGLRVAPWAALFKGIGIGLLLLALVLIVVGLWQLVRIVVRLGVRGLLFLLIPAWLLAVLATGFLVRSGERGIQHWSASAGRVTRWGTNSVLELVQTIVEAPDTVGFAITGQRAPVDVPGVVQNSDVALTPIVVNAVSEGEGASQTGATGPASTPSTPLPTDGSGSLHVGVIVQVTGTEGAMLRAREVPGGNGAIVARFAPGAELTVVAGPEEADGRTWLRVRGTTGEGWCAAEYLLQVSSTP